MIRVDNAIGAQGAVLSHSEPEFKMIVFHSMKDAFSTTYKTASVFKKILVTCLVLLPAAVFYTILVFFDLPISIYMRLKSADPASGGKIAGVARSALGHADDEGQINGLNETADPLIQAAKAAAANFQSSGDGEENALLDALNQVSEDFRPFLETPGASEQFREYVQDKLPADSFRINLYDPEANMIRSLPLYHVILHGFDPNEEGDLDLLVPRLFKDEKTQIKPLCNNDFEWRLPRGKHKPVPRSSSDGEMPGRGIFRLAQEAPRVSPRPANEPGKIQEIGAKLVAIANDAADQFDQHGLGDQNSLLKAMSEASLELTEHLSTLNSADDILLALEEFRAHIQLELLNDLFRIKLYDHAGQTIRSFPLSHIVLHGFDPQNEEHRKLLSPRLNADQETGIRTSFGGGLSRFIAQPCSRVIADKLSVQFINNELGKDRLDKYRAIFGDSLIGVFYHKVIEQIREDYIAKLHTSFHEANEYLATSILALNQLQKECDIKYNCSLDDFFRNQSRYDQLVLSIEKKARDCDGVASQLKPLEELGVFSEDFIAELSFAVKDKVAAQLEHEEQEAVTGVIKDLLSEVETTHESEELGTLFDKILGLKGSLARNYLDLFGIRGALKSGQNVKERLMAKLKEGNRINDEINHQGLRFDRLKDEFLQKHSGTLEIDPGQHEEMKRLDQIIHIYQNELANISTEFQLSQTFSKKLS